MDGPEGTVDSALGAFDRHAEPATLLAELDAAAIAFVADDLIHRLVPYASVLAGLDYEDHPWAALPAGVAICAIDRPRGRQVLSTARVHFEAVDEHGAAFAWFLEGLQDLGEGDLAGASTWWRRAQDSLDPSITAARLAFAHLALGAYGRGEMDEAILLAEEALWSAEQVGDARTEGMAALYLGFFHLYTGRFGCCALMIDRAAEALDRLDPENRYELPLVGIERGGLAAFRGDIEVCERGFADGLAVAAADGNEWYTAIGLTARAEFTAHREPTRSVADARAALDRLEPIGESWWSRWARLALANASMHAGNDHVGRQTCRSLLATDLNPLERGRTLLVLSELERRSGSDDAAHAAATEAVDLLTGAGASFWAARALLALSRTDRRNAEFHRRKARALAADDLDDPAWRRLLRGSGRLEINVLGAAAVRVDGTPVRWTTRAEVEVVAMLAAEGSVRTSAIGDRIWPDDDPNKVAHRVDNLLSSVRRALLPSIRLSRHGGLVELDIDADECDLTQALADARRLMDVPGGGEPAERQRVADTLRKPLLGGLEAPWTLFEQERLRRLADQLAPARPTVAATMAGPTGPRRRSAP